MKITKRQLRRIIAEELEKLEYDLSKSQKITPIDTEEAADVEAIENAWAGGDNLQHQVDHAKAAGGEENSRGQELVIYIAERRKRSLERRISEMHTDEQEEDAVELARYDALNNNRDEMLYRDNPDYREAYDMMVNR